MKVLQNLLYCDTIKTKLCFRASPAYNFESAENMEMQITFSILRIWYFDIASVMFQLSLGWEMISLNTEHTQKTDNKPSFTYNVLNPCSGRCQETYINNVINNTANAYSMKKHFTQIIFGSVNLAGLSQKCFRRRIPYQMSLNVLLPTFSECSSAYPTRQNLMAHFCILTAKSLKWSLNLDILVQQYIFYLFKFHYPIT